MLTFKDPTAPHAGPHLSCQACRASQSLCQNDAKRGRGLPPFTSGRMSTARSDIAAPLIIAGMHRSGTSLTAALFSAAGLHVGETLLAPDEFNRHGYFEDTGFLELQRTMLAASVAGEGPGVPDWGWAESERADAGVWKHFRAGARNLVQERQSRAARWGWKDPRSTLLLNFWADLLPAARFVLVFRAPWEVEDSIRRLQAAVFAEHPDYPLRVWSYYNERLMAFYQAAPARCSLLPLGLVRSAPGDAVAHAWQRLGLGERNASARPQDQFDPGLLRSTGVDAAFTSAFAGRHPREWAVWKRLNQFALLEHGAALTGRGLIDASLEPLIPAAPPEPQRPRVSIVVTCCNLGLYLPDALESITRCDPTLCETIIVDDGSTQPETCLVLDRVVAAGWRVQHQENRGLGPARNAGVRAARGDFILPLDADNMLRAAYVTEGIRALDTRPDVAVAYGDVQFIGELVERRVVPEFDLERLHLGNFIDACAVFRKSAWEAVGGYDEHLPANGHEDWALWLSLAERGCQFHHIPEVTFDYRVRPGSMLSAAEEPERFRLLVQTLVSRHPYFTINAARLIARLHQGLLEHRRQYRDAEDMLRSYRFLVQARDDHVRVLASQASALRDQHVQAAQHVAGFQELVEARAQELAAARGENDNLRRLFGEVEAYARSLEQTLRAKEDALVSLQAFTQEQTQQLEKARTDARKLESELRALHRGSA